MKNEFGVEPCPWCGSKFRIVDPDQPDLIQCDDCRRDEYTGPGTRPAYAQEQLEKLKQAYLSVSQLAELLQSNGLSEMNEDTIRLYAKARTLVSVRIDGDVYFDPRWIAKWMREVLKISA